MHNELLSRVSSYGGRKEGGREGGGFFDSAGVEVFIVWAASGSSEVRHYEYRD